MIKPVIDLHLDSTYHPNERYYRLAHCQMVAWLIENFKRIQSGEVDYHQYERKANSLGIATYREEAFEKFKDQKYI